MKKIICSAIAAASLLSGVTALADTPSIYFNGEKMSFDVQPYISEERTMVPFRAIFEKADADVMWDEDTQTVIAVKQNDNTATSIALQIGKTDAFVNDVKTTLDKAAELTEDRTFVPLRFVMESLGAEVTWDENTYSVMITTD